MARVFNPCGLRLNRKSDERIAFVVAGTGYKPVPRLEESWWLRLIIFITSLTIAVATRSTGYTGVSAEGGHYYLRYRSTRFETSREQYEQTRRRDRTAGLAAGTMMVSLFAFIGIDRWRKHVARFRMPR